MLQSSLSGSPALLGCTTNMGSMCALLSLDRPLLASKVLLLQTHGVYCQQDVQWQCLFSVMLQDAVLIGSRLDASQEASTCRLAFYGRILKLLDPTDASALQQIKIYKLKQKKGSIDRVTPDGLSAVCKGMFKKETNINLFSGMKVWMMVPYLFDFLLYCYQQPLLTWIIVPVQMDA